MYAIVFADIFDDFRRTFVSNNNVLYTGKASKEGEVYSLANKIAIPKNGGKIPLTLKISGLSSQNANQLIGKNVVKLSYTAQMMASQDYKQNAIDEVNKILDDAIKQIDQAEGLTDAQKEDLKKKVQENAEKVIEDINNAQTAQEVDTAIVNYEQQCLNDVKTVVANQLVVIQGQIIEKIKAIPGISDKDIERYTQIIQKLIVEYSEKISQAKSINEAISILTDASKDLNNIVDQAKDLVDQKDKAKEEIDKQYEDAKKEIDNKKNITDEEKQKAKEEADKKKQEDKTRVDDADSKKAVDDIVDEAKKEAEKIIEDITKKDEESTWTVRFEMNGHGSPVQNQAVKFNDYAKEPENPSATGYLFQGWFKDSALISKWQFNNDKVGDNPSNNCTVTLFAKWVPASTTITLSAPDSSILTQTVVAQYDSDLTLTQVNVPTKSGTTFTGFFDENDKMYFNPDGKGVGTWDKPDASFTLVAHWGVRYYEVTFEMNEHGTQVEPQSVEQGKAATRPTDPSQPGYIFKGWFADQYLQSTYDFATPITKDTVIYAKWEPKQSVVVFDSDPKEQKFENLFQSDFFDENQSLASNPDAQTVNYGTKLPNINPPVKIGFVFGGYYDSTEFLSDHQYIDENGIAIKDWDKEDSQVTLYARWLPDEVTVTFDFQNPEGDPGAPEKVVATCGQQSPVLTKAPSKPCNEFLGYFDQAIGGNQIYDCNLNPTIDTWTKDEDTTLYAHWQARTYTVKLDSNGGQPTEQQNITVTYGQPMPSGITKPTWDSQRFIGFYDLDTNEQYYDENCVSTKNWDIDQDNKVLKALWGNHTFVVSFNNNGHGVQPDSQNVQYGHTATDPGALSAEGYDFIGWFKNLDDQSPFDFGTPIKGNLELQAKWTPKPTEVTLDNQGGTGGETGKILARYGEKISSIALPIKTGYVLSGYYDNPEFSGEKYIDSSGAGCKNWDKTEARATLYAKWDAASITVNFKSGYQNPEETYYSKDVLYLGSMPDISSEVVPEREGYTLLGFYLGDTQYYKFQNGKLIAVIDKWPQPTDTDLVAKWQANTTTITLFTEQGGSKVDSVTATFGSALPKATVPSLVTGKKFIGYFDADDNQYYDENGTGLRNWETDEPEYSLFGKWQLKSVNVKFDFQGATKTGSPAEVIMTYDSALPALSEAPEKQGFIFDGYYDQLIDGKQYYASNLDPKVAKWDKDSDTTLYARWIEKTTDIVFDKAGGSGGTDKIEKQKYGQPIPAITVPTLEGSAFSGYFDDDNIPYFDSNGNCLISTWNKEDSQFKLTAHWNEGKYFVNFNLNGHGNQAIEPQYLPAGQKATEPATPKDDNFKFVFWYTNDPEVAYDFDTPVNNNLQLNAKWEEKSTQAISLNPPSINTMKVGEEKTITLTVPEAAKNEDIELTPVGPLNLSEVTGSGANRTFTVSGTTKVTMDVGASVKVTLKGSDQFKQATVTLSIVEITKLKRTIEIYDKTGTTKISNLDVPYFADGYEVMVKYSADSYSTDDKVFWSSGSGNLATSYDEAPVKFDNDWWCNKCTLIGISPQNDSYKVKATLAETDMYEEATIDDFSAKVVPRYRDVSMTSSSGGSDLKVELDTNITLTETHHGYSGYPEADNKATWSIPDEYSAYLKFVGEDGSLTSVTTDNTLNLGNDDSSPITDDSKFQSTKTLKAFTEGMDTNTLTAKIKLEIPSTAKYQGYGTKEEEWFSITVYKHSPNISMSKTGSDIMCYTSDVSTLQFTPFATEFISDDVAIEKVTPTIDGKTECTDTSIVSAPTPASGKAVTVAAGCKGAGENATVFVKTAENKRYNSGTVSFTANLIQNTTRQAQINSGNDLVLFVQNSKGSTEASVVNTTQALDTDLYKFSLTEGSGNIVNLTSTTEATVSKTAQLDILAGGYAKLHVVLTDVNTNATSGLSGYKETSADLNINVDYWKYTTFANNTAYLTEYVGYENEIEDYVTIPASVTIDTAGNASTKYDVIQIGDGSKSIFSDKYCSKVKLASSVTKLSTVAKSAFKEASGDNKLKIVDFGEGNWISSIGSSAFQDCSGLQTFNFPSSDTTGLLETIGSSAFSGCSSLASVSIASPNLKTISSESFSNCENLNSVSISSSKVTLIDKDAFKDSKILTNNNVIFDSSNQYVLGSGSTFTEERVELGSNVKCVAYGALKGKTSLKKVLINNPACYLNSNAFSSCTYLQEFVIKAEGANDKITYGSNILSGCGESAGKPCFVAGGSNTSSATTGASNEKKYNYKDTSAMSTISATNTYYYLTGDISCSSGGQKTLSNVDIVLDLNGHNASQTASSISSNSGVFDITNTTLNIVDSSVSYKETVLGKDEYFEKGTIQGGKRASNDDCGGGGIRVNSGTLNMYGGCISHNATNNTSTGDFSYGGGVGLTGSGSSFNLYHGKMEDNSAGRGGAVAVWNSATFNMYGGLMGSTISATSKGRSNYAKATAAWTSNDGGGGVILWGSGKMYMYGGSILGNGAENDGGGVLMSSEGKNTLQISSGATIKNNYAPDHSEKGCDVFNNSSGNTYSNNGDVGKYCYNA